MGYTKTEMGRLLKEGCKKAEENDEWRERLVIGRSKKGITAIHELTSPRYKRSSNEEEHTGATWWISGFGYTD